MIEALADRVELDGLVGLANKREILAGAQRRLGSLTTQGFTDVPATATATANGQSAATDDPGAGITNRSPVTNYYLNQQPAATPPATVVTPAAPAQPRRLWPWLAAIPVTLGLGGLAGYFWPKPAPQPTPPSQTLTPGASKIGISVTPGS